MGGSGIGVPIVPVGILPDAPVTSNLIESVSPPPDSQGNPLEVVIRVNFNTTIYPDSINEGSFVLVQKKSVDLDNFFNTGAIAATMPIAGAFTFTPLEENTKTLVVFNPKDPLAPNAEYQVILSTDITDLLGVHLSSIYSWKFTTGSGAVLEPPATYSNIAISPYPITSVTLVANPNIPFEIISATPADLATHQPIATSVVVLEFSKNIDEDSLTTASIVAMAETVDGDDVENQASGNLAFNSAVNNNILTLTLNQDQTPLFANNRVSITIRNLKAVDGSLVALPCVHTFTTRYDPRYASPPMVLVEIGAFITTVPEDTINMNLYLSSKDADAIIPSGAILDPRMVSYFNHCKAHFAKTSACVTLLSNSGGYGYKRKAKKLGEMEVSQEVSNLEKLVERLQQEADYFAAELMNLCYSPLKPQMAIKGVFDPDAPLIGRGFVSQPLQPPILNAKHLFSGSRRSHNGYRPSWYPNLRNRS